MKRIATIAVFGAAFVAAVPFASSSTLIDGELNTVGYANYGYSPNMFTVSSSGVAELDLTTYGVPTGTNAGMVTGPPATGNLATFFPAGSVTDYSFTTSTISAATPTKVLSVSNGTDVLSFFATATGAYTPTNLPVTEGALVLYGYLDATGPDYLTTQNAVLDISANGVGNNFTADLTAAAPEPSSLVLLGTGLLGTAGAMFRRLRKA